MLEAIVAKHKLLENLMPFVCQLILSIALFNSLASGQTSATQQLEMTSALADYQLTLQTDISQLSAQQRREAAELGGLDQVLGFIDFKTRLHSSAEFQIIVESFLIESIQMTIYRNQNFTGLSSMTDVVGGPYFYPAHGSRVELLSAANYRVIFFQTSPGTVRSAVRVMSVAKAGDAHNYWIDFRTLLLAVSLLLLCALVIHARSWSLWQLQVLLTTVAIAIHYNVKLLYSLIGEEPYRFASVIILGLFASFSRMLPSERISGHSLFRHALSRVQGIFFWLALAIEMVYFKPAFTIFLLVQTTSLTYRLWLAGRQETAAAEAVPQTAPPSPQTQITPAEIETSRLLSLGTLAESLGHELSNPLMVIQGHQRQLSASLQSKRFDSAEAQRSLTKIDSAARRITTTVAALQSYALRNGDEQTLAPTPLRETIQFALDLIQEKFRGRGVRLVNQPIPDFFINCDQSQLIQLLLIALEHLMAILESAAAKQISLEFSQSVPRFKISMIASTVPPSHRSDSFVSLASHSSPLRIAAAIVLRHQGSIYVDHEYPNYCLSIELPK